ncbi:ABC transporter ATP-binding protein [Ancylobacter sonchi]|uniref:ABC transporter ATP-binding protein n=1 Tax=Ancylobacter sonchi TaxID=1937790 RepID=UPI001BD6C7B1|nr:ABC transporter ATP-binding protein [Ancylobacter sonchi]MBS7533222.1 ABC transporter ATP-binding protein [Ancylobacter sonchi]
MSAEYPLTGASEASDALEARGVVVRFGGVVALSNVNLAIHRREVFGLIGPNGAGKSTLVNVLTGFQEPTEGEALVNGRSLKGWASHQVARIGVTRTFQAARVFPALTALENVTVAALGSGVPLRQARAQAFDALEWIGCASAAGKSGQSINYGDQRRIAMARALVSRPAFVLLDEPAAGMNAEECESLVGLICAMPERWGCGVLLIEHNMDVVMRACSRILVLDGGRPIAEGVPHAIQANEDVRRAYLGTRAAPAPAR